MRNIYILIVSFICSCSFAQDSRLFDNYWFLTNVVKNGVDHLPPTSGMGIWFQQSMLTAHACLDLPAFITFEDNDTNFSATDFQPCLCWCNNSEAGAYEPVYFSFFTHDEELNAIQYFTYSISEVGDLRTLTINSSYNEQAIYSNIGLSTMDVPNFDFSLYPNPSTDFVVLQINGNLAGETVVEFYNELGILYKTEILKTSETTLNTSNLSSGVYFLKIKNDTSVATKKFIKL